MVSDHWDMSLRVIGTKGEAYIPDYLYQKYDDRIVITEWNRDGVATERTLGFEPGEGSW